MSEQIEEPAAVEIKERAILFTGPMIRAILDDRKTQTRRVVKLSELGGGEYWTEFWQPDYPQDYKIESGTWLGNSIIDTFDGRQTNEHVIGKCPYGAVGDRLWVKETFKMITARGDSKAVVITKEDYSYHAVTMTEKFIDKYPMSDEKWRPSIFMPRWASRITLEVTGVKVERLQDITEEDAIAEGVFTNAQAIEKLGLPADTRLNGSAVDKYRIVWESINNKTYPWVNNPWVWCISFRKV
jgi:hypothetical protein